MKMKMKIMLYYLSNKITKGMPAWKSYNRVENSSFAPKIKSRRKRNEIVSSLWIEKASDALTLSKRKDLMTWSIIKIMLQNSRKNTIRRAMMTISWRLKIYSWAIMIRMMARIIITNWMPLMEMIKTTKRRRKLWSFSLCKMRKKIRISKWLRSKSKWSKLITQCQSIWAQKKSMKLVTICAISTSLSELTKSTRSKPTAKRRKRKSKRIWWEWSTRNSK